MADVTGPIASLPGAVHSVPKGQMCDDCANEGLQVPAVKRIQGETDSFGSEMYDVCQKHYDAYKALPDEMANGCCDWCKCAATDLKPFRNTDEGMAGPVYYVCGVCRKQAYDQASEEFADWHDYWHDYDD